MRWFSKLSLGISLPLFLMVLALALTATDYVAHTRLADAETEASAAQHITQTMTLIQGVVNDLMRHGDLGGVRNCISALAADPRTLLALVVDDRDRILAATDARTEGTAIGQTAPQFDAAIARSVRTSGQGAVSPSGSGGELQAYYPIVVAGAPSPEPSRLGVLFLQYNSNFLKAQNRHAFVAQILGNAIYYVIAFVLLGILLRFVVTKRVERLVEATRKFSGGDLTARADIGGDDELARLGEAFNRMVATIVDDQRNLRESESRFRALVEQAGDLFELVDLDGRLLDVNSTACRLLGYTRDELLTMAAADLDPQFDGQRFATAMAAIPARESVTFEAQRRRKDGSVFPVEVKASSVQIGGAPRVLSLVRDITERKNAETEHRRLQTQLNQVQKMESVGRLSGGVAHDFNNMLAVILGHVEIVLNKMDAADPTRNDLLEIQSAAQHSANLTSQLLAFARKQTTAPRVLNVNDTIAKMLKMLQRLIGEDITLVWSPASHVWPVRFDPTQIDQILANLCVNARDAIDGVGTITIETRNTVLDQEYCRAHPGAVPGSYATLTVSDTGYGMAPEVLDHVFEPFFTTKGLGRGTGLGLATVYGIVKQNEGWVTVESAPNKGTTFMVCLPRFTGVVPDVAASAAADAPRGHGETVLLVEDEPALLVLGETMLRRLGYTVLTADSPREAIRIAENHEGSVDLLVTDVVMPEMHGRALADKIAAIRPDARHLFVSGYTADVIANRGVLDQSVHFLQKPFSLQELGAKVRQALDSPPPSP
ncbi:MAG: PAS domain S-box protein [Acidobacteriota bacterium]